MNKVKSPSEALNDVICALNAKIKENGEMLPVLPKSCGDVEVESQTTDKRKHCRKRCSRKRRKKCRGCRSIEFHIFN
ncbi:hypothetical protein SUGI_0687420 [Cryptomeria japonica]|nr:hypothetical protein SUGI_0687420 [Cryptomeria japonica]